VVPDSKYITHDFLIPGESLGGAKPGQIVVVAVVEQPSKKRDPIGSIVHVLGDHMAPGMEIEVAIRSYDLPANGQTRCKVKFLAGVRTFRMRHVRGAKIFVICLW
jgi:exoribonuclease R